MGYRYKLGDVVYVPDKKWGYGGAVGTVLERGKSGLYRVSFTGLPVKRVTSIGPDGKKRTHMLKSRDTFWLSASELRKKRGR